MSTASDEIGKIFLEKFLNEEEKNNFVRNLLFDRAPRRVRIDDFVEEYLAGPPPEYYIDNAFTWNSTPEGHHYWHNLEQKWWKLLEEAGYEFEF